MNDIYAWADDWIDWCRGSHSWERTIDWNLLIAPRYTRAAERINCWRIRLADRIYPKDLIF